MKVTDLIVASAESLTETQRQDGAFPAGHNGPYYDEELAIRNTSHVLVLLLKAFELSGQRGFRDAALKALEYVTAPERRPMGATFWVRNNPEKDYSNGLIGQAWVIEALAYAARELGDDRLNRMAEKVFLLHPFDDVTGRWRVVNVDGSFAPVDMTFNHQLWFAAAGGFLLGNAATRQRVRRFMDKLDANLEIHDNGLIVHALAGERSLKQPLKTRLKRAIKSRLPRGGHTDGMKGVMNKAIGYHAFNTYAFGLLYENLKDHSFWEGNTLARILEFPLTDLYRDGLDHFVADSAGKGKSLPFNRFGYPYNPPGIEMAFTLQTFRKHYGSEYEDLIRLWLSRQIDRTYDPETRLMNRQTDDAVTLAARLYEAVRLSDYELQIEKN